MKRDLATRTKLYTTLRAKLTNEKMEKYVNDAVGKERTNAP